MCVPGVNREAIKYFITETRQKDEVVQTVLAMDATDINPCVRLVYMGGRYEVVGGVAVGSLAGELGLSEVDALQRELNDHAAPLEQAIAAEGQNYSAVHRENLREYLRSKQPHLIARAKAAAVDLAEGTKKYYARNGADYEKGRQKCITQERWRKKEAAEGAVRMCNGAIADLGPEQVLVADRLVCTLEALKVVVISLVEASTHYAVVFMCDPSGKLVVPVVRIFHHKFGNAPCAKVLSAVCSLVRELSDGAVVVGALTYDGAQRMNRRNTAQALAAEAVKYASDVASSTVADGHGAEANARRAKALCDTIITYIWRCTLQCLR